jgi:L-iditol 2-dehydrogenase
MKKHVLLEPKKFITQEVPVPEPLAGQVLLAVKAVGICGSDVHAFNNIFPFTNKPITTGHEATGEVVGIGAGVEGVAIGQRVVIRPQIVCHECSLCLEGRYNICQKMQVIGCSCDGACADYFAVDASLVYELPKDVPYDVGTLIEPLAVDVHAVRLAGDVRGKKVLVIGAGTIGNLVMQSAKALGAAKVMITDVSCFKLDAARRCGADIAVNVARESLQEAVLEAFGSEGFDLVFECSANAGAFNQALELGRKGITFVIVGVYPGMANINMFRVQGWEYRILGSLLYTDEDYVQAIALLRDGAVDLQSLITREYPIEEIAEAYRYIEDHGDEVLKVVLNIKGAEG